MSRSHSRPVSLSLFPTRRGEKRRIQAYPPTVAKPATRSASLEAGDLSVSRSMGRRNRSATPRISKDRKTRGFDGRDDCEHLRKS